MISARMDLIVDSNPFANRTPNCPRFGTFALSLCDFFDSLDEFFLLKAFKLTKAPRLDKIISICAIPFRTLLRHNKKTNRC
jgi:hypothetical protein